MILPHHHKAMASGNYCSNEHYHRHDARKVRRKTFNFIPNVNFAGRMEEDMRRSEDTEDDRRVWLMTKEGMNSLWKCSFLH